MGRPGDCQKAWRQRNAFGAGSPAAGGTGGAARPDDERTGRFDRDTGAGAVWAGSGGRAVRGTHARGGTSLPGCEGIRGDGLPDRGAVAGAGGARRRGGARAGEVRGGAAGGAASCGGGTRGSAASCQVAGSAISRLRGMSVDGGCARGEFPDGESAGGSGSVGRRRTGASGSHRGGVCGGGLRGDVRGVGSVPARWRVLAQSG